MNKFLYAQLKEKSNELGVDLKTILVDEIQAYFLEEYYKDHSSRGSVLFGGGRYRHINKGIRFSVDLDFFKTKGFNFDNVLDFIKCKFPDLAAQKFGVSARVVDIPPWEKIHDIETIRLLLYDPDSNFHQIFIDFDFITREPMIKSEKALVKNVVVLAGDPAESLEEKLISIYERTDIKIRDIFDFWYFRGTAEKLNKGNIKKKLLQRSISKESAQRRIDDFIAHRAYYKKELKNIIISCGEKRPEVKNLLKLDMNTILDYVLKTTREYIL